MGRHAKVTQAWGDGEHVFSIAAIGLLRELQEKTGFGPMETMGRLYSKRWHVDEVGETIRLGLIGGGMKAPQAFRLVQRYVHERPDWGLNATLAYAIIAAAMVGVEEDPIPKSDGEGATPNPTSPADDGGSDASTRSAPPSG